MKTVNFRSSVWLYFIYLMTSLCYADQEKNQHSYIDRWVFGGAYTTGGDRLADIEISSFDGGSSTESLKAGDEFYLYGGYSWVWKERPLRTQVTLGWHFDSVSAGSDTVSFDRYPIDVITFMEEEKWRAGIGFTYHFNPSLDLKDAGDSKYSFDDSLGVLVEAAYKFREVYNVYLRYTVIDYSINDIDLSGDHLGIGFVALY